MEKNNTYKHISVFRLRVGIILFILWWFPIWIIVPIVKDFTPFKVRFIFVCVALIQTIFGIVGAFLAGREAIGIIKKTPIRKSIKTIWSIFIHGVAVD